MFTVLVISTIAALSPLIYTEVHVTWTVKWAVSPESNSVRARAIGGDDGRHDLKKHWDNTGKHTDNTIFSPGRCVRCPLLHF